MLFRSLVNPSAGQWPHYHIWLKASTGLYDSAINLKSLTNIQIEYRVRDIDPSAVAPVLTLSDGWTPLLQNSVSGAWDYVRSPALSGTSGWILQSGDNLINVLRYLLTNVQQMHIFGAQYSTGLGVHDVHMNQGDPPAQPGEQDFAALDAIWQDGGLLFVYGPPQPRVTALQIKFETQSLQTDDQGHPVRRFPIPDEYVYIPWWKWPPENPMSADERQILVQHELTKMLKWASVIPYLSGKTQSVLQRELRTQLTALLPDASVGHITDIANYVVKMGVEVR